MMKKEKKYLARDRDRVIEQIEKIIYKQAYHETLDASNGTAWTDDTQKEYNHRRADILEDLIAAKND
jgi:hypothetical protein